MIRVKYNKRDTVVSINGHAGAGEKGKDLICASVSILVHTLEELCETLETNRIAMNTYHEVKDGEAMFRFVPAPYLELDVIGRVSSIVAGFRLLSEQYPEYVSYYEFWG